MTLPGLTDAGFLVNLMLLAAAIEGCTRLVLEDLLGWSAPPDKSPPAAGARRRYQAAAVVLGLALGLGACWLWGIGLLNWLKLGIPRLSAEQAEALDFSFTGLLVGGGTRGVSALLNAKGLLRSWSLGRKEQAAPAAVPAAIAQEPRIPPGPVLARLLEVEALPGLLWKSLVVPPGHAGVTIWNGAAEAILKPGPHRIRWITSREPSQVALLDSGEFTLQPLAQNLASADGEPVDWAFRLRARIGDPVRFVDRVVAGQPLVDQRALANLLLADLTPAFRAEVNDFEAGALFDSPSAASAVLRALAPRFQELCAGSGLEQLDLASVDFTPALDDKPTLDDLETLETAVGRVAEQPVVSAATAQDALKVIEAQAATPGLLTAQEELQVKQDLAKPGGSGRAAETLTKAIERKFGLVRQRLEDRVEQLLFRERHPAKVDKFRERNAPLLAWASRLRLLAAIILSAVTLMGILRPEIVPDSTAIRLAAAGTSLATAVAAFIGSLLLGCEFERRQSDHQRGWLNRLSAERVLAAEALDRGRTAAELGKLGLGLRELRQPAADRNVNLAIRMKDLESKTLNLRQEVENAETGGLILREGRLSTRQVAKIMGLQESMLQTAEKLTSRCVSLRAPLAQGDWAAAEGGLSFLEASLLDLRNRFSDRPLLLRGA
jgi:hypothetical protein